MRRAGVCVSKNGARTFVPPTSVVPLRRCRGPPASHKTPTRCGPRIGRTELLELAAIIGASWVYRRSRPAARACSRGGGAYRAHLRVSASSPSSNAEVQGDSIVSPAACKIVARSSRRCVAPRRGGVNQRDRTMPGPLSTLVSPCRPLCFRPLCCVIAWPQPCRRAPLSQTRAELR